MPVFKGCPQRIDRIWPYKFSINKSCFRAAHCGGLQEVWRVEGARSGPCKGRTLEEESFDEARLKSSWGQMLECPVWSPEFVTKLMDMVWYGYIYILDVSCLWYIDVVDPIFFVGEYGCSCWLSHASSPAHGRMLVFSFTLSLATEWHSVTRSADFMEMANQPIGKFQDSLRAELKKVNQFACVSWLRQGCQGLSTSCVGKPVHAMLKTAEQICSLACHKLS